MSIPKFYEFCEPILKILVNTTSFLSRKELKKEIDKFFSPTQEDLEDLLSNGSSRFDGNFNWGLFT